MAETATAGTQSDFDNRVPWKALDIAAAVIGAGLIGYGLTLSSEGVDSARFEFADALLSGAAFIYMFGFVLYLTHLIRSTELPAHIGSFLTWIGAAMHTSGMLVRWTISGWAQPPWTNLYESLLFFAWGIVVVYLVFEWRSQNKSAGAFVLPAAVIMMGLAAFSMPASKEIPQLMPALQSRWIQFHVACASIAYASFMVAFGFAILFLIKDKLPAAFSTMVYSIFAAITFLAYGGGDVLLHAEFPLKKPTIIGTGELVDAPLPVPYAGQLFLVALALYVVAAALYFAAKKNKDILRFQRPALIGAFLAHTAGMIQAIYFAKTTHPIPMRPEISLFKWNVNSYLVGLVVLVWLGTLFVMLIDWRGEKIAEKLPAARIIDDWSYKAVLIGLPFMTLNLVTGAIWANNAWGTYWQWDPKETWALITWLTYAAYIHMRMARGWSGRKASSLAIAGFGVVIFTYLGVNLFLSGLHSYGSPG